MIALIPGLIRAVIVVGIIMVVLLLLLHFNNNHGAAALTSTLCSIGPGGMIGGIACMLFVAALLG